MNNKLNFKLNFNAQTLRNVGRFFAKFRTIFTLLAVAGVIGFSLYQVNKIVVLQPDANYLDAKRADQQKTAIKFDTKTLDAVNDLVQVNGQVDLSNLGKQNPFAP
jgi:Tfp pilus assembly protein PilO